MPSLLVSIHIMNKWQVTKDKINKGRARKGITTGGQRGHCWRLWQAPKGLLSFKILGLRVESKTITASQLSMHVICVSDAFRPSFLQIFSFFAPWYFVTSVTNALKILLNLCPHLVERWNYPWRQDSNAAEKCCQLVTKLLTAMSLLHSISRVQESYIMPYFILCHI